MIYDRTNPLLTLDAVVCVSYLTSVLNVIISMFLISVYSFNMFLNQRKLYHCLTDINKYLKKKIKNQSKFDQTLKNVTRSLLFPLFSRKPEICEWSEKGVGGWAHLINRYLLKGKKKLPLHLRGLGEVDSVIMSLVVGPLTKTFLLSLYDH